MTSELRGREEGQVEKWREAEKWSIQSGENGDPPEFLLTPLVDELKDGKITFLKRVVSLKSFKSLKRFLLNVEILMTFWSDAEILEEVWNCEDLCLEVFLLCKTCYKIKFTEYQFPVYEKAQ